jgi:hypothetical protein
LKHLADAELDFARTPQQRLAFEKAESAASVLADALEIWRAEVCASHRQYEPASQKGLTRKGFMHLVKFEVLMPVPIGEHRCSLVELFDDLVAKERAARLAHFRAAATMRTRCAPAAQLGRTGL